MRRAPDARHIELFEAARDLLAARHHPEIHQVAAAVRGSDGRVYLGLHIGSRRVNVCAESSAIANAEMAGAGPLVAMVAVCRNDSDDIVVTNPCGVCRELMGTYAQDAEVMIDDRGSVVMAPAELLMPNRWMFPSENDWTPDDPSAR
ncbi:hypothetical protein JD276_03460 [Leucobacter sp. CSA1]|uniref:CMP/dCMP-type deaminase domain-containing protein n=1 Tax=Leucobacter chromiisoli TaxID=2796471 RepID=A0A934Q7Q6_9MICO|nr:hypothetical protein [Leucobacter chromiisoli]MBK0418087.1 hypothetical protein [Leucobacter chromiisoli]